MSRQRKAASMVHHGPPRGRPHAERTTALAVVLVAGLAVTSACSDAGEESGRVEVEFFQFKGEAVGTFDALIEQFEDRAPGDRHRAEQRPLGADAALRTRLVKNDVPP